jgi:hypothetical protein
MQNLRFIFTVGYLTALPVSKLQKRRMVRWPKNAELERTWKETVED